MLVLERWVAKHGGAVKVNWYRDTFTGKTLDRPGMEKLLADLRAGKVDRIVVWRLDRLGRTTRGLCQWFDELSPSGPSWMPGSSRSDSVRAAPRRCRRFARQRLVRVGSGCTQTCRLQKAVHEFRLSRCRYRYAEGRLSFDLPSQEKTLGSLSEATARSHAAPMILSTFKR